MTFDTWLDWTLLGGYALVAVVFATILTANSLSKLDKIQVSPFEAIIHMIMSLVWAAFWPITIPLTLCALVALAAAKSRETK